MIGIGLHSYGFMDGAVWSLSRFVASQLVILSLALLPRQFWKPRLTAPGAEVAAQRQRIASRPGTRLSCVGRALKSTASARPKRAP
jgi:hypothetical protein